MGDLCWLLSQLTDEKGNILIEGIHKMVAELTEDEKQLYDKIDFDLVRRPVFSENLKLFYFKHAFKSDIGVEKLTSEDPKEILMRRWRYPSLSIHGFASIYGLEKPPTSLQELREHSTGKAPKP
jgi:cytosolic nonspecific dipeptidase